MKRLKKRRLSIGITQAELASRAGVPLRMVQAYEAENSSRRDINRAEALRVARLAAVLDCRVDDILEPEDGEQAE